ncbi:MAG: ParB/RepB/Spo0J family partition protein [Alphaproteobacteria bacterium]|nr:ParB/RepB/Spo0J family partition protein [Alphaproteobacteria bacterium]
MSEANPKNRGLGRGLNALFEDDEEFTGVGEPSAPAGKGGLKVGIELLEQSRFQPRKMFDDESLSELADSIKAHGLLQPILVRETDEGRYEIIAGERRWRAAQRAQLHDVPIIVKELTDVEALEIALIENLQREDLNPVDEAMGYQRLMKEYSYTQEQLAESLGKSRPYIANMVRLLNLPDVVLAYLERGDLTAGHARALVTAKDPESLAREVVSQGLSVRETERLAAEAAGKPAKASKGSSSSDGGYQKDVDTLALEKDLSDHLGMRVSIDSKDGESGKVSISFKSLDQLDDVLKKLSS